MFWGFLIQWSRQLFPSHHLQRPLAQLCKPSISPIMLLLCASTHFPAYTPRGPPPLLRALGPGMLEATSSELDAARQQVVEVRQRWQSALQDLRDCERSCNDHQQRLALPSGASRRPGRRVTAHVAVSFGSV